MKNFAFTLSVVAMSLVRIKFVAAGLLISLCSSPLWAQYQETEWLDLLTPESLLAFQNPDLTVIDHAANNFSMSWVPTAAETDVVEELDGALVRIAGYIVPLEFDDDFVVTEFFLVPYYGACIHVPPPPPNQVIHVVAQEGVRVEALYFPFWVEGKLATEMVVNSVAQSSYSITADKVELYQF